MSKTTIKLNDGIYNIDYIKNKNYIFTGVTNIQTNITLDLTPKYNPEDYGLSDFYNIIKKGNDLQFNRHIIINPNSSMFDLQTITIKDYFKTDYANNNDNISLKLSETKTIKISDYLTDAHLSVEGNGTINGTDYNENFYVVGSKNTTINTGAGDDYINTWTGNDIITLGTGNKHIGISKGSGNDTVYLNGADTLYLDFYAVNNENNGDILKYRRLNNDLVIISPNGKKTDSLTIKDYFSTSNQTEIYISGTNYEYVKLSDLTEYIPREITGALKKNNILNDFDLSDNAGSHNSTVTGGNKNDTITLSGLGEDTLNLKNGNDTVKFENVYGGENSLTVTAGKGTKTFDITKIENAVFNFNADYGDYGIELGNGISIYDYFKSGATLVLKDSTQTQTIKYSSKSINGTSTNDIIYGSAKADTIKTGAGSIRDIVYAGAGNDKIYAQATENILKFDSNFGNDTVYLSKVNDNSNILEIKNTTKDNIQIKRVNNSHDVKLVVTGETTGSILLKDYLKNTESNVIVKLKEEQINLIDLIYEKNANILDYSNSTKGVTIKGSYLQEEITGSSKKDTINAIENTYFNTEDKIEKITAGKGNDVINMGEGKYALYFANGDGNDTVTMGKDVNTHVDLIFSDITDLSHIITRRGTKKNYYNLYIDRKFFDEKGKLKTETITVKNYYKNSASTCLIKTSNGQEKPAIPDEIIPPDPVKPTNPTDPTTPTAQTYTINKTGENIINSPYESGTLEFYRAFADRDDLIIIDKTNNTKTPIIIKDFFTPDNTSETYIQYTNGNKTLLDSSMVNYNNLGYYLEQTPNFTTAKDNSSDYTVNIPNDTNYTIYGTYYKDYILIQKDNNLIYTNGGNDIIDIESTSGKNYIKGGNYNDSVTCIFNGLNSYTTISSSKNTLQIKGIKPSELNLFINVTKENFPDTYYISYGSNECIILDGKHQSSILKGVANLSSGIRTNIDSILSIEQIDLTGKYIDKLGDWSDLKANLIKEIQDYLKDRPYTSAFELFDKGTTAHKQELYNIYQKWFEIYKNTENTSNVSLISDDYISSVTESIESWNTSNNNLCYTDTNTNNTQNIHELVTSYSTNDTQISQNSEHL